jgi:hypothetical protein
MIKSKITDAEEDKQEALMSYQIETVNTPGIAESQTTNRTLRVS